MTPETLRNLADGAERDGYMLFRDAFVDAADTIERLQRHVVESHSVAMAAGNQSIETSTELYLAREQLAEARGIIKHLLTFASEYGEKNVNSAREWLERNKAEEPTE